MIIVVMSDSHNNRGAIRTALEIGTHRGAQEVIHCGDVSTAAVLDEFAGWTLHLAFGNTDRDWSGMRARVARLGNRSECGEDIRFEVDGLRLYAVHGDRSDLVQAAFARDELEFLFRGHTHSRQNDLVGKIRVINPGALGGSSSETRSFCLLDTALREVEFIVVEDQHLSPE